MDAARAKVIAGAVAGIAIAAGIYVGGTYLTPVSYSEPTHTNNNPDITTATSTPPVASEQDPIETTHIETPEAVKAIYMTSWVAGTPDWRERLFTMIDETELNAVVIDIKDYSGKISFLMDNEAVNEFGATERRIGNARDVKRLINDLHERDIYVIGRITVFQDPYLAPRRTEWAVQNPDGSVWEDKKGLSYIDPSSQDVWDYTIALSKESYDLGFDEINLDYIRFPSDGNISNARFPLSGERPKADVIEEFFAYVHEHTKDTGMTLSADLFGMVTTNRDDLNIGQVLERATPYFDYIAPMVYPSHYPSGFNGHANPNDYPYEVVNYSMERAVERLKAATTSPQKLRPWLQDFDYGGDYGPAEVRAQIQATYDAGLDGWMLWSPGNNYTREALEDAP